MRKTRPGEQPLEKFVRVTGLRGDRFVEFEFSINGPDLTVELILPVAAFEEFCVLQEATVLPPEADAAEAFERAAWRLRQPGLLRRVKAAAEASEAATPGKTRR